MKHKGRNVAHPPPPPKKKEEKKGELIDKKCLSGSVYSQVEVLHINGAVGVLAQGTDAGDKKRNVYRYTP